MSWKERLTTLCKTPDISWFDVLVIGALLVGGYLYLHDFLYWGVGWVGDSQYGDAEFWWNGAVHLAQGIIKDNPGKGFRPGYFILTGLTLPVLGMQFQQYYPAFLSTFLVTSSLLYLALRQPLGRWAASCGIGMLVFNPYTAEWLATSTTDATGLLLHMAALTCLLIGVNNGMRRNWLIAFAILFSLATLTRPLLTPFIGVVLVALLCMPQTSFKHKLKIATFVLAAFCLPTIVWMTMQKFTIDRWSLSSNDASAFYAASDPDIQVWRPDMNRAEQLAAEYYHVEPGQLTDKQMNATFWRETLKNYLQHKHYHLQRLAPHIFEIAKFSPKASVHGTNLWQLIFLSLIAAGMALWLFINRYWQRGLLLAVLALAVPFFPIILPYLTLTGAALALFGTLLALLRHRPDIKPGMFLLSAYWLTGILALYFVGGTWGKPELFSPYFAINALGYRLGSQVFFVGDLLIAYLFVCIAYSHHLTQQTKLPYTNKLLQQWQSIFAYPRTLAGGLIIGGFTLFSAAAIVVYTTGASIIFQRAYARHHDAAKPYPTLYSIIDINKQHIGNNFIQSVSINGSLDGNITLKKEITSGKTDVIFTGTISPFVWNFKGQQRAQIMVHAQKQIYPYTAGPGFVILDIPQHVDPKEWIGKQGAFVIHQTPDKHNLSNLPYYLTTPIVRSFIPISFDGKHFDKENAVWFSIVKNATQLETSHELQVQGAKITWAQNSGQYLYQRRFFLTPVSKDKQHDSGKTELILHVATLNKPATLTFSYMLGNIPDITTARPANSYYDASAFLQSKGAIKKVYSNREPVAAAEGGDALKNVQLTIPAHTNAVKIVFNHLAPETGVWIYEYNLNYGR